MNLFKKKAKQIKESFNKYLEKLAKNNKQQFGSSRLDCCQLNKKRGKR